jgi:hypothetical protein
MPGMKKPVPKRVGPKAKMKGAPKKSGPKKGDPKNRIVEMLFRAVLRRAPKKPSIHKFTQMLRQGKSQKDLLKALMKSGEFRAKKLVSKAELRVKPMDSYDIKTDAEVSKYWTPSVQALSGELRRASVDNAEFNKACDSASRSLADKSYIETHKKCFYELACIVKHFVGTRTGSPRVLDIGVGANSEILRSLFPNVKLSVADHASKLKVPRTGFHAVLPVDLEGELAGANLGGPYELIVVAEVIQHLRVSPVKVLQFLIGQLAEGGSIVLTTPNLFARSRLRRMSARRSPLPPYPRNQQIDAEHPFDFRMYGMKDMLDMIEEAGGQTQACWFSPCSDEPATQEGIPPDELRNLCLVAGKGQKSAVAQ